MDSLIESARDAAPEKSTALPPLATVVTPPADPEEREKMGQAIWMGLWMRFENRLSEADRDICKRWPPRGEPSADELRLMHAFDDFLLHQFAEFGWLMLLSYGVIQRIAEWQKHSPHLLERFGKELGLKSRILRGEAKAPLLDGIERFADGVILELNMLLHRQKAEFGKRKGVVSCERIAEWMKLEIKECPKDFPLLAANIEQLHGYVTSLPKVSGKSADRLTHGQMRGPEFFYLWYATLAQRSVKDVKNQLSSRRRNN